MRNHLLTTEELYEALGGKYKIQLDDDNRYYNGEVIEIDQLLSVGKVWQTKLSHQEALTLRNRLNKILTDIERVKTMPAQMRNDLIEVEDQIEEIKRTNPPHQSRRKLNILEERRKAILKGFEEFQGFVSV